VLPRRGFWKPGKWRDVAIPPCLAPRLHRRVDGALDQARLSAPVVEPPASSPSFEVYVDKGVRLGIVSGLCDGPGPPSSHRFQSQQGTRSPGDVLGSGASSCRHITTSSVLRRDHDRLNATYATSGRLLDRKARQTRRTTCCDGTLSKPSPSPARYHHQRQLV
jgi:hypothetical protein